MQFMATLLITMCGWSCSSVLRVYMSICTYILLLMTSLHRLGAPLLVRRCTSVPAGGPLPPRPQMPRSADRLLVAVAPTAYVHFVAVPLYFMYIVTYLSNIGSLQRSYTFNVVIVHYGRVWYVGLLQQSFTWHV